MEVPTTPYLGSINLLDLIFKGLDLIDRVPEELWTEVPGIVQEAMIKTIPKKRKCKKAKWLSEEPWVEVSDIVQGAVIMIIPKEKAN